MHHKLEARMRRLGEWIAVHPIRTIVLSLAFVIPFVVHVPHIQMDTSNEGFLHDDDPILLDYNAFRRQFGRDERIAIAIKSDHIFTLEFLRTLRALHEELEEKVPYLDEVTSLLNVRNTRGEGDRLITDDLLEPFPRTQAEVDAVKRRALASHFYRDLLLSGDGKMTTIIVETDAFSHEGATESDDEIEGGFDADEGFEDDANEETPRAFLTDEENSRVVEAVMRIVRKYRDKGLEIYVAGSPVVVGILKRQMQHDMQTFTRVTFAVIVLFLFAMFRRVSAVIYPLLVVVLSLLATVGLMAWTGTAFKLPTQIVPSLLLAVGVGATVHVLSIFFDRFDETGDKKESIAYTLGHSGLAIAMTGITTAIGIGSFAGSEVAPISDMGFFASFGVLVSLVLTLTLLPALLRLTRLKPRVRREPGKLDRFMAKLSVVPVRYTRAVLLVSALLVVLALSVASRIEPSHNPLHWFDPDKDVRIGTETIDRYMHGSLTLEMTVDTGEENGWQNAELLHRLDAMARRMEHYKDPYTFIGKVMSLPTIVKETNRALHENDERFYTVPDDNDLVAQELLLFENSGSDDLEDVVDSQFSKVRITAKIPWVDSIKAEGVITYAKKELHETFPEYNGTVTGIIMLLVETFVHAIDSSIRSYFIAFGLIALMMMFILGSWRLGLLSMIPNLTPIVLGLLLMVVFHIPLDMFTLLIGSIAIGLAVDDTIHFTHNFRRYYIQTGNSAEAIRRTFFTTGKAMVITTLVLSFGFYAYMFAQMSAVRNFGFLTGSVIILALLADLFLAPALMIYAAKWGWIEGNEEVKSKR